VTFLEVKNLTKVYETGFFKSKPIVAVDNVSFTVNEGEIVSLVGESGSGKTTTARIILRLLNPTKGEITLNGESIWNIPRREYWKMVQGVFQDPYSSFNPTPFYKVDRLLRMPFKLLGTKPDIETISHALLSIGLDPKDVLGKYPHELSGGQRQRILIARCLIVKPKLLLADEPTSMLDASTRATVLNLLKNLKKEMKMSIIFITHDIGQAFYISDRMIVMYKGKIVEQGPVEKVIFEPEHPYTKRLVKDVPKLYEKWEDLYIESK